MKTLKSIVALLMLLLVAMTTQAQENDFPKLIGPYLGQKPPGELPEVFARNIFPDGLGYGGFVFSNKGDEVFFFAVDNREHYKVMYSSIQEGYWQPPVRIKETKYNQVHPFYSPEGDKIFFGSDMPVKGNAKVPYFNIWFIKRTNVGWCEPEPINNTINSGFENCGTFNNSGLFLVRRISPQSRGDIYISSYSNGLFEKPVKMPPEINTAFDESHPAISQDGSCLLFSSKRPGGFNKGRDDLWICFRKEGKWTKATNMGKLINNGSNTSCATISPDGKYIFFVRIENGVGIPYWVSAKFIEKLKQQ